MVIKRQKLFFAPLAALGGSTLGNVLTGGMLVQGGIQMKQSSDQAAEMEEQNREQTRALNRIAKAAKENPQVGQDVLAVKQASDTRSILDQREFAGVNGQTWKNIKGFGDDLRKFAWGKRRQILSGAVMAGTMTAGSAVVDKMIQKDAKRIGMPIGNPPSEQDIPKEQKQYSTNSTNKSVLESGQNLVKRGVKATGREFKDQFKGTMGKILTPAFIVAPGIGYLAERSQFKDQIASTQKQFAKVASKSMMNGIRDFFKNPGQNIKSSYGSFKSKFDKWKEAPVKKSLNTIGGLMGQRGDKMAEEFVKLGESSKNPYTQKMGEFLTNHGKTAAVGGLAVGGGIMAAGWGQGEKLTKKAIKSVDPNAFAYQESKEQQM